MPSDFAFAEDPSTLSHDALDDAMAELCAHLDAGEYWLIQLITEWESRGLHGVYGVKTTAHWLSYRCGIALGAAREKVRVARALPDLPKIHAAFARGEVSFSKVRAVTRIATPDNEGLLLGYCAHASAAQIETVVRLFRRVDRLDDPEAILNQRRKRGLRWHFEDDGMLVLSGRFPPEEGALILKAIEVVRDRMARERHSETCETAGERIHGRLAGDEDAVPEVVHGADALVRLVEAGLAADPAELSGPERTHVVVHVPVPPPGAEGPSAPPEFEDGPPVPPETARRLACDCGRTVQTETPEGAPLSIGRRSRTVPHWLRRAVRERDRGCRFPGCTQVRHVDAHHIHHWADGGETSLDNLVLLCRHHHRLVHEEGFGCERTDGGGVVFRHPSGRVLPEHVPLERGDYLRIAFGNVRAGLTLTPRTTQPGDYQRRPSWVDVINVLYLETYGPKIDLGPRRAPGPVLADVPADVSAATRPQSAAFAAISFAQR
jgi:hypothetical protein